MKINDPFDNGLGIGRLQSLFVFIVLNFILQMGLGALVFVKTKLKMVIFCLRTSMLWQIFIYFAKISLKH